MRALLLTMFVILSVRLLPAQVTGDSPSGNEAPVEDIDPALIARIKDQPLAFQWTVGYMQGVAQTELRDSLNSIKAPAAGYGFGGEFGRYFDPVPVFVGVDVGLLFHPSDDRTINSSSRRSYSVSTSNLSIPIMTTVRFQPSIENWVYPYAEFVAGMTIFTSDVTVRRIFDNDTSTTTEGNGDFTWSYGVGLGAAIKVADIITLPNSLQRTLIDIRFRYMTGSQVEVSYADLKDESSLDYEIRRTQVARPSLVFFRIGLTFQL